MLLIAVPVTWGCVQNCKGKIIITEYRICSCLNVHFSCIELCGKINITYAECLTLLSLVTADRLHTFFIIGFGVMKKYSLSVFIDRLSICARLIQLLAIEAFSSSWGRNDGKTATECSVSFDNSVIYWLRTLFWTLSIVTVYQNPTCFGSQFYFV